MLRSSAAKRRLGGKRRKVSPAKQAKNSLISDKIKVLVGEGKSQKQAAGMAYGMLKEGRLRPGGVYVRKGSK